MPGKRKKDRKGPKASKGTKKLGTSDRGNHSGQSAKVQPRGSKNDTKVFTLKDEAAKSTFRSSKRLWQGEGQKLRNLPVEFVRALENYDPGQYLREQIESNAKKQSSFALIPQKDVISNEVDASTNEVIDASSNLHGNSPAKSMTEDLDVIIDDEQCVAPVGIMADEPHVLSPELHDATPERDLDSSSAFAPTESTAAWKSMDQEVTNAVEELRLDSTESLTGKTLSTSNVDLVLHNLLERDSHDANSSDENPEKPVHILDDTLKSSASDDVLMKTVETPCNTDAELFVVDIQGESILPEKDLSDVDEVLLFRPKQQNHEAHDTVPVTTPWARTIEDPVLIDELDESASSPSTFVAAFDSGSRNKRGNRGGTKKSQKQYEALQRRRQDEVDVMFDYMENANWTDESDTDEYNAHAEPLINQLLSDLQPADEDTEPPGLDSENIDSSTSVESEDDTDIDDDLELMIDAEVEEMEFDLGYSGGRSRKGARYGADREMIDSVLYHEDFNVFQYNSAAEESSDELTASGGRKRGLNKFIDDLDLSDEELEASLIAQWKKDRGSKKAKKRDRQRQHQAGLIGKKAKRARTSHEFDTRSSGELDGYHVHIKRFVTHADYVGIEELPMPAMDKAVRRAVHVLSQAYGLKSASQGSGKRRHIILYKTKHSAQLPDAEYLEETLFRAKRSLGFNSKYRDTLLPEAAQKKLGRSGKPMRTGRDGGGAGGRLRDGDLVGADAPEIAIANRGRQMLEKLGWLRGSGLGAVGKEGINLPLFATIKNSKHGLQ